MYIFILVILISNRLSLHFLIVFLIWQRLYFELIIIRLFFFYNVTCMDYTSIENFQFIIILYSY